MQRKAGGGEGRKPPRGKSMSHGYSSSRGRDRPSKGAATWESPRAKGTGPTAATEKATMAENSPPPPTTTSRRARDHGGGDRMFETGNKGPLSAPHIYFGRVPCVARRSEEDSARPEAFRTRTPVLVGARRVLSRRSQGDRTVPRGKELKPRQRK